MCEANACIACCAFDDGSSGFQEASFFGMLDDVEGGAIFDGAAWILEFSFAEDIAAGLLREALQSDQRGFPNCYSM